MELGWTNGATYSISPNFEPPSSLFPRIWLRFAKPPLEKIPQNYVKSIWKHFLLCKASALCLKFSNLVEISKSQVFKFESWNRQHFIQFSKYNFESKSYTIQKQAIMKLGIHFPQTLINSSRHCRIRSSFWASNLFAKYFSDFIKYGKSARPKMQISRW